MRGPDRPVVPPDPGGREAVRPLTWHGVSGRVASQAGAPGPRQEGMVSAGNSAISA